MEQKQDNNRDFWYVMRWGEAQDMLRLVQHETSNRSGVITLPELAKTVHGLASVLTAACEKIDRLEKQQRQP